LHLDELPRMSRSRHSHHGFFASAAARLKFRGKRSRPSAHSPAISPLAPSVPRYDPEIGRTSSCNCLSWIVTVVAGISRFPLATLINAAVAAPSAAGDSFNPSLLTFPPSSTPSQTPSNSFGRALLGGGAFTFASPFRVRSKGAL